MYSLPQIGYSVLGDDPERPFTDFVRSTLAAQDGRASLDTMRSWQDSPIAVFRFCKPPQDTSTEVNVRISFKANLGVATNIFLFAAYQAVAVLDYDSAGACQGVTYAYAA